jgi:predicted MFS family arabinose efflux permease
MADPDPRDYAAPPRRVLPVIVAAQFACTSLWFAVNAVMTDLQRALALPAGAVGTLTSAVQLGFIAGTLVFALLAVADRHSPRQVFLVCALAGALATAAATWLPVGYAGLVALRALTGFCLAGIYPVGMKIAAGWYRQGLGAALGWLVGALVLGTALPHALRATGTEVPWQLVMAAVSVLAAAGGVALWALVPDSPHVPRSATLQWRALAAVWADRRLRASVFGYFGHMVELYTLWVLAPAIAATRLAGVDVSWAAFATIGAGALGCVVGGLVARRSGSARVAGACLATSGACCLLAPWGLGAGDAAFGAWLFVWGFAAAGDSPQFSTLTAHNAPPSAVGSVLTLVNSIGFALSVVSIELFVALALRVPLGALLPWLALGPALGLWALAPLLRTPRHDGPS